MVAGKEEIKKIAVFRALQLGDMLCAIPAIRALRKAFPSAEITLLGLPWAKSLTGRFSNYFNHFIHFPGYPGLPEQDFIPTAFTSFLKRIQEEEYDLVLQMQGNGSIVNPMVELFGGKYTAGFCKENDYCPATGHFIPYPEKISEIERHLKLMNHLGIESQGTALEFPLLQQDYEDFKLLNLPIEKEGYVCVHPGSRGAWRQWPTAHFASLADECAAAGFKIVLTGTREEMNIIDEVKNQMKYQPLIAAGKTSLGAVGVLINNAYMLISNCTGVSHIASACETRSIVISMDGEPERWAPLNKNLHRTINWLTTPDFDVVLEETKNLLLKQHAV